MLLATAAGLCLLSVLTAAAITEPPAILITGARILDAAGDKWLDGQSLLIENGRIKSIAPEASIHPPTGTQRIDAAKLIEGKPVYLIPGLIDLHTHLLLHPYNEAKWDDQVLREPLELRVIRATVSARATLEAGFTTIRELGTEGAAFADVALRDAINAGLITGPRIFASTRAIVATGCYGPAGFDQRWQVPKGGQEADGPDAVRKAVREQIAAGADWVKLYGDYRRAPGAPATPTFSLDELRAAVDEAKSAGRPVAVHATTDEGIRRAVEAGVTTIEHGYGASRQTLELMKAKGITLCPTMAAAEAIALYSGWRPDRDGEKIPPGVAASRACVKLAMEVGVTIACGSDAGVFPHGDNAREIELMIKDGMSPAAALRAATSGAAKVLGKDNEFGALREGLAADLVLVEGDPLTDIGALRGPLVVIARGTVVISRPTTDTTSK
jgi:imidazolonepropionase-like amidohydrolase